MAKPPGPGKCVHCLRDCCTRTWDHVFPKAWYPDTTSANVAKWQIPSCPRCNKEYGKLEEELLIRIGLCLDPNERRSSGIPEKALRAIDPKYGKNPKDRRRRQAKREKILRETLSGDEIPGYGIYPGFDETWGLDRKDQMAIRLPAHHIRRLTEKIVRGIFYVEDQQFIEVPYRVQFFALNDEGAKPVKDLLTRFGSEYAREPGIVVRRAVTSEDNTSSLFEIEIWGRMKMHAAVDVADA